MLVGVDEQTALVRTGDGPWEVMGAGGATVYRKGAKPKSATSGAIVGARRRPYDSLIVTLSIVALVGGIVVGADRQCLDLLHDVHARVHASRSRA